MVVFVRAAVLLCLCLCHVPAFLTKSCGQPLLQRKSPVCLHSGARGQKKFPRNVELDRSAVSSYGNQNVNPLVKVGDGMHSSSTTEGFLSRLKEIFKIPKHTTLHRAGDSAASLIVANGQLSEHNLPKGVALRAGAVPILASTIMERFMQLFGRELLSSWTKLLRSLQGSKQDSLIMLIATAIVIPLFKRLNTSPIVGFMLTGTLLGPSGLNWVRDLHRVDMLGELGIVFFLFEMGLELSSDRLKLMRKDVFGLGTSQFAVTTLVGTLIGLYRGLSPAAAVTIGGSLALSSSAFVLQLLKDKGEMGTRHGRASFGILLLQDLAVVPLLIVVELLSKGGAGLGKALGLAAIKGCIALTTMSYLGRRLLNPIFSQVAKSNSQEAFLSIILATVLLMSFITHGIGLSDTLGAFLAGLLLSETSYKYQIESDIAPFRGLLLGLFFITVGFSVDIRLLYHQFPAVMALLTAMIVTKTTIITALSRWFGLSFPSALHTGLLTSQGGELGFVAFTIAEKSGMISTQLSKLLLTTVALSMAGTPLLSMLGAGLARKMEANKGFTHYTEGDGTSPVSSTSPLPLPASATAATAVVVEKDLSASKDFVFIVGYGRVGQLVCEMLDRKCIPYVVLESSPQKAIEARNKGLPVYFGDINRPELLRGFHVDHARACVLTLSDMSTTNKAVVKIRKLFPDVPIVARARNPAHQQRLESMFDEVYAMAPVLAEDSVLLTLPFAGAVLRNIGVPRPEIEAIMEDVRKQHIDEQTSAAQLFAGADEDEEEGDGAEKSDYAVDGKFRVRDANKIAQTVAAVMKSAKSRRRQQQGKDGKEASGHEESGRGEAQKAAVTQEAVKALTGGASVAAAEKQEKVSSTRYVQEVRLSPELLHAPSVGDE